MKKNQKNHCWILKDWEIPIQSGQIVAKNIYICIYVSQLFISSMTKMRTVPQLVSAPLNPKSCYSKSSQCSLWQPNSPRQPSRKRLEPSASFALKVLVGSHFPAKKKTGYGPEVPAGLQKTRKPNGTLPFTWARNNAGCEPKSVKIYKKEQE